MSPEESNPPNYSRGEWSQILGKILTQMNCQTGTIHRFNPQAEILKLIVHVGIPEQLMDKVSRIPIGKGIAGAAAEKREPIQLCNLQTDTTGVARPEAKATNVAGSLAVPVMDGDELIGTLGVGMFSPHEFDQAETKILEDIAATIAQSLRQTC